jgi:hypothetical protein
MAAAGDVPVHVLYPLADEFLTGCQRNQSGVQDPEFGKRGEKHAEGIRCGSGL